MCLTTHLQISGKGEKMNWCFFFAQVQAILWDALCSHHTHLSLALTHRGGARDVTTGRVFMSSSTSAAHRTVHFPTYYVFLG